MLTKNLISSLERLGLGKYLVVVSYEGTATKSIQQMNGFSGRVNELANDTAKPIAVFSSKTAFKEMAGSRKIFAIKYYLSRGHHVMFVDSDIAVMRDFRYVLPKKDLETYDIIIQDGRGDGGQANHCTGFMYLRASPTTLNFTDLEKHKEI